MHPLAMSVPVQSAFAVPSEIGDNKAMAARLLSGVLGIPRMYWTHVSNRWIVRMILRNCRPTKPKRCVH